MAVKNAVAKVWALPARGDGNRYSLYDTSAPPAPGNPSATAVSDSEIQVDCDASVDPGSTVTGYRIYGGLADGGPYPFIWSVPYAAFPYSITQADGVPLAAETTYYFKITAVNAFGLETALGSCTQVSDTTDAGAGGGGTPLFFDSFGYVIGRNDSKAAKEAAFAAAGWTRIFDEMTFPGSSGGYISTASSIPGYSGPIPGASGRMLRLEATVGTSGVQNDLHVQLGSGTPGDIPANVWFQHWLYINRSGSELSDFLNIRNKWLYPLFGSNSGYPMATTDTAWLCDTGNTRFEGNQAITAPVQGAMTFRTHAEPGAGGNRAVMTDQVSQGAGQQMTARDLASENDHWLLPNTWYLVKYNFNVAQNPGSHRIWWREYGQHAAGFGNPRVNFVEGVTSGFTYDTYSLDWLGAKFVRMPVTVGTTGGSGANYYIYQVDFAMAASEGDLPQYGSY